MIRLLANRRRWFPGILTMLLLATSWAGHASSPNATGPAPPQSPLDEALSVRRELAGGLVGSKHDFTQSGQVGRDLCLTCHTPHLTQPPVPRLDRRSTTTQPLRPYQSFGVELTGWSLLCLGCHDGITAPDVYASRHAMAVADQFGSSRLGTRGLRSHPVGVRYPAGRDGYRPRAAVESAGLPLPDGRIQCTTCHDAHNTAGHRGMLRISNERSVLCLTCHRR